MGKDYPESSSGDYLHALIKGGISSIPLAGGVISEFFSLVVSSPLQKRQENWLKSLYEEIKILADQLDEYKAENLSQNENFISAITQSTTIAIRTHNNEKLIALKNSVLNSVNSKLEDYEQSLFINYIDELTPLHISTLYEINSYTESSSDSLGDLSVGPGGKNGHLKEFILTDLDNKGLIEKKYRNDFRKSKNVVLYVSKSKLGENFLKFISNETEQ